MPVNDDFYPAVEDDDYYATEEDDFYPATIVRPQEAGGRSEGCLYDCVNDCVSIDKLTAYRDCVDFCGRSCDQ